MRSPIDISGELTAARSTLRRRSDEHEVTRRRFCDAAARVQQLEAELEQSLKGAPAPNEGAAPDARTDDEHPSVKPEAPRVSGSGTTSEEQRRIANALADKVKPPCCDACEATHRVPPFGWREAPECSCSCHPACTDADHAALHEWAADADVRAHGPRKCPRCDLVVTPQQGTREG